MWGEQQEAQSLMALAANHDPLATWSEPLRQTVLDLNRWMGLGFLVLLGLITGRKWSLRGVVNLTWLLGWCVFWPWHRQATPTLLASSFQLLVFVSLLLVAAAYAGSRSSAWFYQGSALHLECASVVLFLLLTVLGYGATSDPGDPLGKITALLSIMLTHAA